jgi:hypothetical protein
MPVPEPLVIRVDSPCKALKLIDNYILLGLDNGELRVYDRKSLEQLGTQCDLKAPVLKLSQAKIAIIA